MASTSNEQNKKPDPEVSEYFRELAKKRVNPYLPFKDPKYASEMSKRRWNENKEPTQEKSR